MEQSPIVIQALWRTRSTYFWSLFRNNPRIRAYNEPLHEGLASKTDQQWYFDFKYGGIRNLRHPEIQHHYFTEYPLRRTGGVALFDASMSYGNFLLGEADEDPALEAYLKSLVAYAAQHGQQACFKFIRGGLRASFIQRKLGGAQIYLNRPPAEIRKSFASFGAVSYFTTALTYLAIRYAERPFCGAAIEMLRALGPFDDASMRGRFDLGLAAAEPISVQLNAQQTAILVATFWLAYLVEGLAVADCVIDTERLGCDEKYRASIDLQLAESWGHNALANYRSAACSDDLVAQAPTLRQVLSSDERLRSLITKIPARCFDSLGDASRRLLDAVI